MAPIAGSLRKLDMPPQSAADLSIVIVNFNTCAEIQKCLESLTQQDHGLVLEIIVVDNQSSDASVSTIRSQFPQVKVIEAPRNGGFSYGNNIGIEHAHGRCVLLLNPDTVVPKCVLAQVVERLDSDPTIGLVGVAQETAPGKLESSALRLIRPRHFFALAFLPKNLIGRIPALALRYEDHNLSSDFTADAVTGCFLAVRRGVFESIGPLQERIFMYGEELEFAWRVREAGLQVLYMGSLHIEHRHGASTRDLSVWRDVQMQSGQLLCIRYTQGVFAARMAALAMTIGHLLRLPIETLSLARNRKERLDSRTRRLGKSIAAIINVPTKSAQEID